MAASVVAFALCAVPVSADWTTYHHDNAHSGNDNSVPPVAGSGIAWTSPNLAGDVTAEPLYFNGVVYVATMQDDLYALDPNNGTILCSYHIETPTTSAPTPSHVATIFRFIGIMGGPVIDPATGTLYAVGIVSDRTYHFWNRPATARSSRYAPALWLCSL